MFYNKYIVSYIQKDVNYLMKPLKNILLAFILNLAFAIFELFGGIFTGSVAILSDSIHDIGDASSIGMAYFLERKSRKQPDNTHTYGYLRYSVLGGAITNFILLFGSIAVILNAVSRLINPTTINYNGMIIFACIGTIVNFVAAYFTHGGDSINQKAVNLHMLEDMLGWIVVLIGAVVMKFTDFRIIDPLMSIAVAIFILINSIKNLKVVLDLFLEKLPLNIDIDELKQHILGIDGILDIHHIHIRSIDGNSNYATMHIVTDSNHQEIKEQVRKELEEHGICHSTLEIETPDEQCNALECHIKFPHSHCHHHHH